MASQHTQQSSSECLVCGTVRKEDLSNLAFRITACMNDRARVEDYADEVTTVVKPPKAFSQDEGTRLTVVRNLFPMATGCEGAEMDSKNMVLLDHGVFDRTNSAMAALRPFERCTVSDQIFQFLNGLGFRINSEVLSIGRRYKLENGITVELFRMMQEPAKAKVSTPLQEAISAEVSQVKGVIEGSEEPKTRSSGLVFVSPAEKGSAEVSSDAPWLVRVTGVFTAEQDAFKGAELVRSFCDATLTPQFVELSLNEMLLWN